MVLALLIGLVAGFGMSIPPGPISIAVIRQGIQGKGRAGFQIGIGAAVMDLIYALGASFASSAIILNLRQFLAGHAWMEPTFQALCIVILVYLGKKYVKASAEDLQSSTDEELAQESRVEKLGFSSPFMLGILMGIMNLANPPFFPSLIAVAGFVQAKDWIAGPAGNILYAVGFGIGVIVWFMLLLRIILKVRDRLPTTYFTYIFKIAGMAFFLFAGILLFRIIFATDWAEIL